MTMPAEPPAVLPVTASETSPTIAPPPFQAPPRPARLLSIDALRGFDMFWIIGGDAVFRRLGRLLGPPLETITERQLEHVPWQGFVFYDLIFPLFLFLVGVVIPFSMRSHRARGESNGTLAIRIARRVLLLILLGLINNGLLRLDFENLRYAGVLQRIGICYGAAAVLAWILKPRGLIAATAAILLGYWALMAFVPAPGGKAGDLSPEGNLSGYIDRTFLPGKIMKEYYGHGDNEGILSTIPAVATALLGVLAGTWLLAERRPWTKVGGLVVAGLGCLAVGLAWGMVFPIIKNLWTSSFVLVAGGLSMLLLALFYAVIDILGAKWLALPFAVIGANAIVIYVAPRFLDFDHFSRFFLGGVARLSGNAGPLILEIGTLVAQWLFLYYLWRRRWFLRV